MPHHTLHHGDCVEVMAAMDENSVDAIVTDPPYALGFMSKAFDTFASPHEFQRWSEQWAREALRVLKPGGHILAAGGSRTYHRLASAIEDAGFEIRDCVTWHYATGFPKSHNLHDDWEGWGTALKPATEFFVLARKPLIGTVAANVQQYGVGALNIDGTRIATDDALGGGAEKRVAIEGKHEGWSRPWMHDDDAGAAHAERVRANVQRAQELGRWPANVIFDEEMGAGLDAQTGESKSTKPGSFQREMTSRGYQGGGYGQMRAENHDPVNLIKPGYGDSGGASRFFFCAKASKSERGEGNTHPTVKPLSLMKYLCRLITPPNGTVLDPFAGSGTTLLAALAEGFDCIGIEREAEYVAIIERRLAAAPTLPLLEGIA